MDATRPRKLTLSRETLRNLEDADLRHVVGGTDIVLVRVGPKRKNPIEVGPISAAACPACSNGGAVDEV